MGSKYLFVLDKTRGGVFCQQIKCLRVSVGLVVVFTFIELDHDNKFLFFYYNVLNMKFQQ